MSAKIVDIEVESFIDAYHTRTHTHTHTHRTPESVSTKIKRKLL